MRGTRAWIRVRWLGVLTAIVASCTAVPGVAADWDQFRGPSGDGRADADLPVAWSETEGVVWKVPTSMRIAFAPSTWEM